ncbi:hypothetical protein M501DRAFT_992625 [Patellaria atrata CBS 101060]|uniref:Uncharacterized protein n=1 Tax=Patellaria atrata CBS 101060 TaxID=1346257 RepID=A0A9P4VSL0_9PEZI|nr:hypothetical protein M501DRAFT_992625 [Patellaria atrata CBS 101060]
MHVGFSLLAAALLSVANTVLALPEPDAITPSAPTIPPYTPTCPASTPFTTISLTTITKRYTTVITTSVVKTVPTTATLPRSCPSWYTEIDTPPPWTTCSFNTATCITLACIEIRTRTTTCHSTTDPCCTRTVTDTSFAACPTACPTSCGSTSYVTATLPCSTTKRRPTITLA